jgi:hypothetical protein
MRGAEEGVRRHGLLPAAEAARRVGRTLPRRPRAQALPLRLPDGTEIVLTDNLPLSFARLAPVLDDGLTPEDWLAMLDARVFFWVDPRHGAGNARARERLGYRSEWQVYDTERLLRPVWDLAEIAPINTGATVRRPARRGRATFAPLAGLDWERWRRARGLRTPDTVREVTVRGPVPHAGEALLEVRPA